MLLRTTRQVRLTEIGRLYLARCHQLLADMDELEGFVRHRAATLGGTLRVAGPLTYSELHLAPAIEAFMQAHPALSVELHLTDGFVDLVQQVYDVAIRIGTLSDSSLVARRIAETGLVCCASPHYLARRGIPHTPADLAQHDLVVDRISASPRAGVSGSASASSVRVQGRLRSTAPCSSVASSKRAPDRPDPGLRRRSGPAAGRLQRLPFQCEPATLGVYAVYPQRRHLAPRVRAFVDFLAAWFGATGGRPP